MVTTVTDDVRWHLLQKKRREIEAAEVFALFRSHGIQPIMIKGWASARFYPPDSPRHMGDLDIAVPAGSHEISKAILESKELHYSIDLHREFRLYDKLRWDDLYANSEEITVSGGSFRVLRPEDHLRVICVHWLNDGGARKEKLLDIVYAVQNRPANFDWDRCLGVVSAVRRRWIVCAIGLAHKYYGLDLDDLPFADEALDIPEWVSKCVEKEWSHGELLDTPVSTQIHDPKRLIIEIRKRIPPNPIRATIEMEGDLYGGSRHLYQAMILAWRSVDFLKKLPGTLVGRPYHYDK
ncbi:MAG: nucleotidyltransferase family protein [Pyrinomonadaceae bacterium]